MDFILIFNSSSHCADSCPVLILLLYNSYFLRTDIGEDAQSVSDKAEQQRKRNILYLRKTLADDQREGVGRCGRAGGEPVGGQGTRRAIHLSDRPG